MSAKQTAFVYWHDLFRRLDAAVDEIMKTAFGGHAPPPTLAHYTRDVATVEKILSSRRLWATECTSSSGGQDDLKVATSTIKSVLADLEAKNSRSRPIYSSAYSSGAVRTNYDKWQVAKRAKVYVACVTSFADSADMWNSEFGGYGWGASIEFERLANETLTFTDRGLGLYKVEYDLSQLRAVIVREMGKILEAAKPYPLCADRHGIVGSGLFRVAAIAATLAKGAASAYQKEWRIAIVSKEGVNIETQEPGNLPRTDFFLRANPDDLPIVVRVVLGPENPPRKVEEVRAQLAGLQYGTEKAKMPEIVISSCPPVSAKWAAGSGETIVRGAAITPAR